MACWLSSRVTGSPPLRVRAHVQGPSFSAFWLRSVIAITASVRPKSGRIICRIRLPASDLVPFYQRRPGSYREKTSRIRSGWPGQALAERIWTESKLVCKNHRARFWQNAAGPLPVPPFQTRLSSSTDGPDLL